MTPQVTIAEAANILRMIAIPQSTSSWVDQDPAGRVTRACALAAIYLGAGGTAAGLHHLVQFADVPKSRNVAVAMGLPPVIGDQLYWDNDGREAIDEDTGETFLYGRTFREMSDWLDSIDHVEGDIIFWRRDRYVGAVDSDLHVRGWLD